METNILKHIDECERAILRHVDECERAILTKMDANFRRVMVWTGLVFLATIGNIIKDFLR